MGQIKKLEESSQQTESNRSSNQAVFQAAAGPPVLEILDAEKKPTEELNVGTMEKSFVEAHYVKTKDGVNPGKATFDPDKDENKFFVRLKDINESGEKQINVKLSTQNPNPKYDEKDRKVVLKETGEGSGIYESDPLLLTSDAIDDAVVVNKIEDNQCDKKVMQCDQTFQTMLGGQVKVDYPEKNISTTAKVPIVKELDITINILKKDGQEAASREDVERQVEEANEIYASVGIKINANIVSVDVPEGVNLSNGFSESDEKALFDKLATPNPRDVQVFYVGKFDKVDPPSKDNIAVAYAKIYKEDTILNDKSPDDNRINNVVMSDTKVPFVLAHEIGHVLTQDHHYPYHADKYSCPPKPEDARNVMAVCNINREFDPASNAKRWTAEQIDKMQKSPLLKDPELEKQSLEEKEDEEKDNRRRVAIR
ncbi:MAG: hypothetical protein R3F23_04425 [Verrucomicrobiia bacterium]